MTEHKLSDEELRKLREDTFSYGKLENADDAWRVAKAIAFASGESEWHEAVEESMTLAHWVLRTIEVLEKTLSENTIMREALESIDNGDMSDWSSYKARKTLAKVRGDGECA